MVLAHGNVQEQRVDGHEPYAASSTLRALAYAVAAEENALLRDA